MQYYQSVIILFVHKMNRKKCFTLQGIRNAYNESPYIVDKNNFLSDIFPDESIYI